MSKKRKQTTIQSLKDEGYKVFLKHHKREDGGRVTKAAVYSEALQTLFFAEAKVKAGAQFSRAIGRAIALGRAVNTRSRNSLANITPTELPEALKTIVYTVRDE